MWIQNHSQSEFEESRWDNVLKIAGVGDSEASPNPNPEEESEDSESNLENFNLDQKEEIEHQIVVDSLRRRLGKYGTISESERRTHNLGGIVHFLTDIKIKLKQQLSISEVLKQIHPTPAVGTVPRNKSNCSPQYKLCKTVVSFFEIILTHL